MTRDAFAFYFKESLISGVADIDKETDLLDVGSIQLSRSTKEMIDSKFNENEEAYWNLVDELCEAMDKTKMFNDEVFSVHIA